jgi:hypothetical protein
MSDRARELLQTCISAQLNGMDFPTVWQEILKKHPLVADLPVQGSNSEGPTLGI